MTASREDEAGEPPVISVGSTAVALPRRRPGVDEDPERAGRCCCWPAATARWRRGFPRLEAAERRRRDMVSGGVWKASEEMTRFEFLSESTRRCGSCDDGEGKEDE